MLGGEVVLRRSVAGIAWVGARVPFADGPVALRDSVLGVSWVPLATDRGVVRVQPGINVPTGSIDADGDGQMYFTPLSTSSFDPYVVADAVVGTTWLAGGSVVARAPLYAGWDRRRQGVFGRVDARLSRRIRDAVPWVGLSAVRQFPSEPVGSVPEFSELAATVGLVVNAGPEWSVTGQLRGPLWTSEGAERQLSAGLAVRRVLRRREPEHSDDDGHDHGP